MSLLFKGNIIQWLDVVESGETDFNIDGILGTRPLGRITKITHT